MLENQLELILVELNKMDQIRNCHVFYPYYPKVINDSWDYSDFGLLKNKSALTTIADAEPTMRKRQV